MGKNFHLGDVLSITDGHLVSPKGMGGVYDILNYMTGESLYTHALLRAVKICAPELIRQHPQLENVNVPDECNSKEACEDWLEAQAEYFGEQFNIEPLPVGHWEAIDPLNELRGLIGPDKPIIVVEIPESEC